MSGVGPSAPSFPQIYRSVSRFPSSFLRSLSPPSRSGVFSIVVLRRRLKVDVGKLLRFGWGFKVRSRVGGFGFFWLAVVRALFGFKMVWFIVVMVHLAVRICSDSDFVVLLVSHCVDVAVCFMLLCIIVLCCCLMFILCFCVFLARDWVVASDVAFLQWFGCLNPKGSGYPNPKGLFGFFEIG